MYGLVTSKYNNYLRIVTTELSLRDKTDVKITFL